MKIALVYEKFISRGGLENYLYRFAQELVNCGHHLQVITGQTDSDTERLANTEIRRIPRRSLRKFSGDAEKELRNLEFDVSIGFGRTVAHDFHRAGGGCHRFYSEHVLHPLKRCGRKNCNELRLERELYTSGKTRHFVVNSAMVAQQLEAAYHLDPEKISVVHTAVDAERYCPASGSVEKRALRAKIAGEPSSGRKVFLFVSMNHRRKGLDGLLMAWERMDAAGKELWIVGPEPARRYRRMIPNGGNVKVFVQPPDLVPFYQAADFFIHPTLYDACANTVLQSMACGLPGIISQRDGAQQFIDEGETGWLMENPESVGAIADRISAACELSPATRERVGARARARVLPLTWDAHVDRWMELIEQARARAAG